MREDAYLPHLTTIAFDLQHLSFGFEFGFDDVFQLTQVSMCGNMSAAAHVAQWIRRLPPEEEISGSRTRLEYFFICYEMLCWEARLCF